MSRPTVPSKRAVDAQEAAWVADEDRFVLQQAKKKAVIRIKGGRGQAVDWLAVTLALTDPDRNAGGEEWEEVEDLEVVDPESVLEGMTDDAEWMELERGIETYVALETSRSNVEYWNVCWFVPARGSSADADRPPDDEDHLPRPAWTIDERPTDCAGRELGVVGSRQTPRP